MDGSPCSVLLWIFTRCVCPHASNLRRFEAFCYDEAHATRLLHSDACDEQETIIRSEAGDRRYGNTQGERTVVYCSQVDASKSFYKMKEVEPS